MGKMKYRYHPDDDESDYRIGTAYKGKVFRRIITKRKHLRAVEVEFPDGKITTVHKKSFDVSGTSIDFYPNGVHITLKKIGYMADRRVTKWVIMTPLKFDLYSPDGIKDLQEYKQFRAGVSKKCAPFAPPVQKEKPSIVTRLKSAITSFFSQRYKKLA